jgi:hypothetical protein
MGKWQCGGSCPDIQRISSFMGVVGLWMGIWQIKASCFLQPVNRERQQENDELQQLCIWFAELLAP